MDITVDPKARSLLELKENKDLAQHLSRKLIEIDGKKNIRQWHHKLNPKYPLFHGFERTHKLPQLRFVKPANLFLLQKKRDQEFQDKLDAILQIKKEIKQKLSPKSSLLKDYSQDSKTFQSRKGASHIYTSKGKRVLKPPVKPKKVDAATTTKKYQYSVRADMPYWFDQNKEKYLRMLNDNSNLSIDDSYDPEAHIHLDHFETISRVLDYKDIVYRFMMNHKMIILNKEERINNFRKLLAGCSIMKSSMIELDAYLTENVFLVYLMQDFFERYDAPEFVDKRLNKQENTEENRYLLKREKDVLHDDLYIAQKY